MLHPYHPGPDLGINPAQSGGRQGVPAAGRIKAALGQGDPRSCGERGRIAQCRSILAISPFATAARTQMMTSTA